MRYCESNIWVHIQTWRASPRKFQTHFSSVYIDFRLDFRIKVSIHMWKKNLFKAHSKQSGFLEYLLWIHPNYFKTNKQRLLLLSSKHYMLTEYAYAFNRKCEYILRKYYFKKYFCNTRIFPSDHRDYIWREHLSHSNFASEMKGSSVSNFCY